MERGHRGVVGDAGADRHLRSDYGDERRQACGTVDMRAQQGQDVRWKKSWRLAAKYV